MFPFETIVQRRRIRGASGPKLFYKLIPFLICSQVEKRGTFFRRNNERNIFGQPKSSNLLKTRNSFSLPLLAHCAVRCVKAGGSEEGTRGRLLLRHD